MSQDFSTLKNNGFLEILSTTRQFIEKEKKQLEHAENYLIQYGYQPICTGSKDESGMLRSICSVTCHPFFLLKIIILTT